MIRKKDWKCHLDVVNNKGSFALFSGFDKLWVYYEYIYYSWPSLSAGLLFVFIFVSLLSWWKRQQTVRSGKTLKSEVSEHELSGFKIKPDSLQEPKYF